MGGVRGIGKADEATVIAALRRAGGEVANRAALRALTGLPMPAQDGAVSRLRHAGKMAWGRYALSPSQMMRADDDPAPPVRAARGAAETGGVARGMGARRTIGTRGVRGITAALMDMIRDHAAAGLEWPVAAVVAQKLSCSVPTVRRALGDLMAAGVIDWQLVSVSGLGPGNRRMVIRILATGETTARPADRQRDRTAQLAERREADAAAQAERLARVRAGNDGAAPVPGVGARLQLLALNQPHALAQFLRSAWPETHDLLTRLSAALAERPIPLIVRLIREEAHRLGLNPSRSAPSPAEHRSGAAAGAGSDADFDAMEDD